MIRLMPHAHAKPWGKDDIGPLFDAAALGHPGERLGEVWFEHPDGQPLGLLVKYLFTSEKLSVQVHPDDEQAAAMGETGGKEEAWVILDAEPQATLGLGVREPMTPAQLRAAAVDGSIEERMDWKPVRAGDAYHVTPGTIHAIGAGLVVLEVQQYSDVTYRLYDYGRPRPLHLDESERVARAEPYAVDNTPYTQQDGSELLVNGPKFRLVRHHWKGALDRLPQRLTGATWFIPLTGSGRIAGESWQAGDCFVIGSEDAIFADAEASALFACEVIARDPDAAA